MRPPYPTYLLQVQWVWDHRNTEYATLTVEGQEGQQYESGFEILTDPAANPADKEMKMMELREIATTLNRWGGDSTAKLVRLYRIVDRDEIKDASGVLSEFRIKLEPICEFDSDGNPVAPARLRTEALTQA